MIKLTKNVTCDKCECLSKGIFCQLANPALGDISDNKVMNHYKKGQTLYLQGNPGFGLYCINSGKVKITKMGNDGKETIIRIAGPGDVLGHYNLFTEDNHSHTATILEEGHICFIDKKFLNKLIEAESTVTLNIIRKMSQEISASENKNAAMSQKNVRERLAELLLELKQNYGIAENGRYRLDIRLTREEIASMVGTANETIIRFISEFKDEGLIHQEGKVIYLVDEKRLMKTANMIA
jgi:CRP-like cAMP-binding protein